MRGSAEPGSPGRRLWAAGCAGALAGAVLMLLYQGRELDQLRILYRSCATEKAALADQVRLLSEKLQQRDPQPVVESLQVEVRAPDALAQLQVSEFVQRQLAFLINRPLAALELTPDLPYRLLDGRTVEVDQQPYTLRVRTVVVARRLFLALTAVPA
ncbi:MAG: hypothetical protein K6T26_00370 [Alicyclobacillus sp.]|nr:hypothetical protein [Alicyclobacillus sp.]